MEQDTDSLEAFHQESVFFSSFVVIDSFLIFEIYDNQASLKPISFFACVHLTRW